MRRRSLATAVSSCTLVLSMGVGGCAGAAIEDEARRVRGLIREAQARGAQRCSPTELALSESHVAFAERKLEAGDRSRARDHVAIADRQARRALALSPPARCAAADDGGLRGTARRRVVDVDLRPDGRVEATGFIHTSAGRSKYLRPAIAITQP